MITKYSATFPMYFRVHNATFPIHFRGYRATFPTFSAAKVQKRFYFRTKNDDDLYTCTSHSLSLPINLSIFI